MIKIMTLLVYLLPAALMSQSNQDTINKTQSKESDDKIFPKVEQEAVFSKGQEAWQYFIAANLKYPYEATMHEIQGTVFVEFVINEDGSVSDVVAVSGPEELRGEGVRIIKKSSGRWKPAKANGLPVRSRKKQPFVFRLTDRPGN